MLQSRRTLFTRTLALTALSAFFVAGMANAADNHTSKPFQGKKANQGTVSHAKNGTQHVLTLSNDFKVPDAPAPHWQVVDSKGNVYLLQRLVIKGDKFHQSITLPPYVQDVAKVRSWCAWAESLLGEAMFETVQK